MNLFSETFKKNMKSKYGKGLTLALFCLLYGIFRVSGIISNPIYILDVFMLIVLVYSIYLIKFKFIN